MATEHPWPTVLTSCADYDPLHSKPLYCKQRVDVVRLT
uniref:Uncharacterized protein n=1 Tax=Anguilla anguilla TaxID=7936 RepID=A0A0E9V4U8_ANGAN